MGEGSLPPQYLPISGACLVRPFLTSTKSLLHDGSLFKKSKAVNLRVTVPLSFVEVTCHWQSFLLGGFDSPLISLPVVLHLVTELDGSVNGETE